MEHDHEGIILNVDKIFWYQEGVARIILNDNKVSEQLIEGIVKLSIYFVVDSFD